MAGDLAGTPVSGLDGQLCGDAHLANFGMFASPRGPCSSTSTTSTRPTRAVGVGPQATGREPRRRRAGERLHRPPEPEGRGGRGPALPRRHGDLRRDGQPRPVVLAGRRRRGGTAPRRGQLDGRRRKRLDKSVAKARTRDHLRALDKLTAVVDGQRRIIADPPVVVARCRTWLADLDVTRSSAPCRRSCPPTPPPSTPVIASSSAPTRSSTWPARRWGSAASGQRCWIVLMRGRDDDDPLFLQVKQAEESVLAP